MCPAGTRPVVNVKPLIWSLEVLTNKPFPSSLVPLFENESKCEAFHMKISSECSFIFMQIKVIFTRIFLHLDSLHFETEAQRNSEMENIAVLHALLRTVV